MKQIEKCKYCSKEFIIDTEEYYWHLKIHKLDEQQVINIQPNYPIYNPIQILPNNPNLHYHGSMPCYNNPCIWC